jgi:hypothetical protein
MKIHGVNGFRAHCSVISIAAILCSAQKYRSYVNFLAVRKLNGYHSKHKALERTNSLLSLDKTRTAQEKKKLRGVGTDTQIHRQDDDLIRILVTTLTVA